MIILDTCILENFSLDSISSDLLKTIATSGVDVVAVPDVVMTELVSHRVIPQREKHEKAVDAFQNYATSSPWLVVTQAPDLDLERLTKHWRAKHEEIVQVVDVSASALREAYRRESMHLPPCSRVEVGGRPIKIGGRDAAIWLTAVEYAREHQDETVVFVSANTSDFGTGSPYPYPMNEDVAGLANFVHLTSFTDLISRFATPSEVQDGEAQRVLSTPEAAKVIQREVRMELGVPRRGPGPYSFEVATSRTADMDQAEFDEDDIETVVATGFIRRPQVKLSSVRDIKAHEIAGHVWCSATARWLLSGIVGKGRLRRFAFPGAASWETRVLFSPTQSGIPLTVLRTWSPKAATAADFADMPALPSMAEVAEVNARWDGGRGASFPTRETSVFVAKLLSEIGDTPMETMLASIRHGEFSEEPLRRLGHSDEEELED